MPGRTEAAPSSQRTTQPTRRPPDATITTANGVSVPTASPLSSSAAPARGHHRDQCESRDRSVPTTNATNAVSTTNIDGLLPCSTACCTVACSIRQTADAMMAAAAPASPATTAFSASRHWLRTSTTSDATARTKQATPATTAAAYASQRGMCSSQRETSSAASVLPRGSARMVPSTTATIANAKTASSRSAGRRTRSGPGSPAAGGTASGTASAGLTAMSVPPRDSSPTAATMPPCYPRYRVGAGQASGVST